MPFFICVYLPVCDILIVLFDVGENMKEKNKYHFWDIINLAIFYSVFICFLVSLILGIIDFAGGDIPLKDLLYRISLLLLICVPYIIKKLFKISFSRVVGISYYIYMFLAGFLGVGLRFYSLYEVWDVIVHLLMGVGVSLLGGYVLNLTIYRKDKNRHNLLFTFIFMICFTLAIGALWEMLEFACDLIFDTSFQRYQTYSGIALVGQQAVLDTMIDLIMDFLGSIVGVAVVFVGTKCDKNFLKSFHIKKLKKSEKEVEDILE